MRSETQRRSLTVLKAILAAEMLSTAIHYTHNFVDVSHYPGPKDLYTVTRVAIVVSWPLLTWIGLMGYRRYREGRLQEARVPDKASRTQSSIADTVGIACRPLM